MWQIFLGSLVLSLIHGLIPNHWIPLVLISKTEKWNIKETISATVITGFSHMMSTIIIGIIVGFIGIKLSESYNYITKIVAPVILILVGVIYFLIDLKSSHHHHHFDFNNQPIKNRKSKLVIILSLSIAMFFSPCLEIEAYYFQAASLGWIGILIVSTVYLFITLSLMVTLVYLGLKGINRFNWHFLEHHEKRISGIVLILLGLFAYFFEF
jgi:nickel/cobalt transporter (NicO) family protein